jgi:type IV fimbrial biogenesis protein FimT
MLVPQQRGVTLIELMIGISIVAILLAMGAPSFNQWIQNTQNRTAAESILNGLQLARMEAVRRNTQVRFDLTDGSGRVAWNIGCVTVTADCPVAIQSRDGAEGGVNARAGVSDSMGDFSTALTAGTGLEAGVTFNGLGRVVSDLSDPPIARVDITNAAMAAARRFIVTIETGGQVRMCDPVLDFPANPQGCS